MNKQLWKAVNPGTNSKDKPNMKHLFYKQHAASRHFAIERYFLKELHWDQLKKKS
ncbi:Uncharacterized protein APZ42_024126 [Daphnia magna]|uniref:Uncharacterized protein n=1 Tax=Daphnia magna TaxID=35525 RepID=A0A0P5YET3_9CRUS|nr:Uncharacterized protein APZ42_024126 [Daphnia magna]